METLADQATGIIVRVAEWLINMMLAPLNGLLRLFASAGAMRDLTTRPEIQNLVAGAQGVAMAVLALRVAWEALQMASLRAEGAPTDPGGLLKRTVMSAAAIFAGPWVAREMMRISNLLAQAVAQAGLGAGLEQLDPVSKITAATSTSSPAWVLLLALPGVILLILIFFQGLIRTVEISLAAIISPLAALGYMSGGGMADVWWREVVVLSTSQAVQMLLLYMGAAFLVAPQPWVPVPEDPGRFGAFLFVAALWVTFRTPHILRNYAYSTGASGVVGAVGHSASYVAVSRILSRLPI